MPRTRTRRITRHVNTKPQDNTRYVIRYVTFHPGYRPDMLPTLRTVVYGKSQRDITTRAIKSGGGKVVDVRTGWFA
jgi:hypothetical protein